MYFKVLLPLPPTLNEQINLARSHWSVSAKTKKFWGARLRSALAHAPKFSGQVWQQFTWIVRFSNDPDNVGAAVKFINDALTDLEVLTKDNLTIIQSPVIHHYRRKDKGEEAGVIMEISDTQMEANAADYGIDELNPF